MPPRSFTEPSTAGRQRPQKSPLLRFFLRTGRSSGLLEPLSHVAQLPGDRGRAEGVDAAPDEASDVAQRLFLGQGCGADRGEPQNVSDFVPQRGVASKLFGGLRGVLPLLSREVVDQRAKLAFDDARPVGRSCSLHVPALYGRRGKLGSIVSVAAVVTMAVSGCSAESDQAGDRGYCATLLVNSRELCGQGLVEFCRQKYDPQINADICRATLRAAGFDPRAIARRNAQREETLITGIQPRDRRTLRASRGESLSLAGENSRQRVLVNVERLRVLPPGEYSDPKGEIVGVYLTVVNQGTRVLDDSPAADIKLLLADDRQLDPSFADAVDCSLGDLQAIRVPPNGRRRGCVPFDVPDPAQIRKVQFSPAYGNGQLGEWRIAPIDIQR